MQQAPVLASATHDCVPESPFYAEGALTFTWELWHGVSGGRPLKPKEGRAALSRSYGGRGEVGGGKGEGRVGRSRRWAPREPSAPSFPCAQDARSPSWPAAPLTLDSDPVLSVQGYLPPSSLPALQRLLEQGKAVRRPARAGGRSREVRAVSGVSLMNWGGGERGETETGKPREGACWEDQRFERGGKDQPAGRAVRGAGGGPWEARAHLVTVRRARGLCALSRPRRAPMPASTSSAATPHTA